MILFRLSPHTFMESTKSHFELIESTVNVTFHSEIHKQHFCFVN